MEPDKPKGNGCLVLGTGMLYFLPTALGDVASMDVMLTSCEGKGNRILAAEIEPPDAPFAVTNKDGTWDPSAQELTIPAWQQKQLSVRFEPVVPSPFDNGVPVPIEAKLRLQYSLDAADAPAQWLELPLSGLAIDDICITQVVLQEVQEATPLAVRLDATGSLSPAGPVTGWQWQVDGPDEATTFFHASANSAAVVFGTDTAGEYAFAVDLQDGSGTPQCDAEPVVVTLGGAPASFSAPVPGVGLEVKLRWRTPGDWHPDDGEQVSNLDLHVVHEWAGGPDLDDDGLPDGWFDTPYDCWAGNPGPHWGVNAPDSQDDPDFFGDEDPEGPEQVLLPEPEDIAYRIGVHYRDDGGLGPVFARVAIYLDGELKMETDEQLLDRLELWEAATIDWPARTVSDVLLEDGTPKVLGDYSNPYDQ